MSLRTRNATIAVCLAVSVAGICDIALGQTAGTQMNTGNIERLTADHVEQAAKKRTAANSTGKPPSDREFELDWDSVDIGSFRQSAAQESPTVNRDRHEGSELCRGRAVSSGLCLIVLI
jgi:hypothetical protein